MKNATSPRWYLRIDGRVCGPYSRRKILEFASQGQVPASAMVWRKGCRSWVPAATLVVAERREESSSWGSVERFGAKLEIRKRLQLALVIITASPFLGVFAGPVVGLGVFESYMFGPLCGFALAGSVCRDMIFCGRSHLRGSLFS